MNKKGKERMIEFWVRGKTKLGSLPLQQYHKGSTKIHTDINTNTHSMARVTSSPL